jgi:hypothetical protein
LREAASGYRMVAQAIFLPEHRLSAETAVRAHEQILPVVAEAVGDLRTLGDPAMRVRLTRSPWRSRNPKTVN